jgi:hypothetical protein
MNAINPRVIVDSRLKALSRFESLLAGLKPVLSFSRAVCCRSQRESRQLLEVLGVGRLVA